MWKKVFVPFLSLPSLYAARAYVSFDNHIAAMNDNRENETKQAEKTEEKDENGRVLEDIIKLQKHPRSHVSPDFLLHKKHISFCLKPC